jgi:hypothetical protein
MSPDILDDDFFNQNLPEASQLNGMIEPLAYNDSSEDYSLKPVSLSAKKSTK